MPQHCRILVPASLQTAIEESIGSKAGASLAIDSAVNGSGVTNRRKSLLY
jgi:hypothetical protein